jgi:hypothetical protein
MGKFNKGILGGFSGKVGNVVGSSWKGITYIKSQPTATDKEPTSAQVSQQAKFKVGLHFVQSMAGLVALSFRNYAIKMSGFNNAFSYTMKHAVTGVYPVFTVDYSMVLVSRGDLPNATTPTATVAAHIISYAWADNSGTGKAKPNDKAILAVYCADLNQTLYTSGSALRSAGTDTLDVSLFAGKQVETYIGFISDDGKEIANSVYTGQLVVPV